MEANKLNRSKWDNVKLIFILGLIAMLMPLAIDMYLPAFPEIAKDFQVSNGNIQLTISIFLLGFGSGQLFFGPLSDSLGRKPVMTFGLIAFILATIGCALSVTISQFVFARFIEGLTASACVVVINAFLRDLFVNEEFARMVSFVTLVMTIAPLLAPILGGYLLILKGWHSIFWAIAGCACLTFLLVSFVIKETKSKSERLNFNIPEILRHFIHLLRRKKIFYYILSYAFSGAGLFSFLSLGPFVYIGIYGVSEQNFGYYFGFNVACLFIMNIINSHYVMKVGSKKMIKFGFFVQGCMVIWMVLASVLNLGLIPLIIGVAGYVGCISMVSSNTMALVLKDYPHIAGTASSLIGTSRFFLAGIIGSVLAFITHFAQSHQLIEKIPKFMEYAMVFSIIFGFLCSILFYYFAERLNQSEILSEE